MDIIFTPSRQYIPTCLCFTDVYTDLTINEPYSTDNDNQASNIRRPKRNRTSNITNDNTTYTAIDDAELVTHTPLNNEDGTVVYTVDRKQY